MHRLSHPYRLLAATTILWCAVAQPSCPAAQSGPGTTSVIELYTSEGCDSCPPADRWFSGISFATDHVLPLAFHVDYWDGLGWKDRFGQSVFAERQRASVVRQGSRTVYTPQLLFDGKDARGIVDKLAASVRGTAHQPSRAGLRLQTALTGEHLEVEAGVTLVDTVLRHRSALYLAVTENHLASRVTAGENLGVTLRHDHVVRLWSGPIALRAEGELPIRRQWVLPPDWKRADLEIAAFVQDEQSGEVLQALATPACLAP